MKKKVFLSFVLSAVLLLSTVSYAKTESLSGNANGTGYSYTMTMTVLAWKVTETITCSAADTVAAGIRVYFRQDTSGSYAFWNDPNYSAYNSAISTYCTATWTAGSNRDARAALFSSFVNGTKTRTDDFYLYLY